MGLHHIYLKYDLFTALSEMIGNTHFNWNISVPLTLILWNYMNIYRINVTPRISMLITILYDLSNLWHKKLYPVKAVSVYFFALLIWSVSISLPC
jgi:hypothetical protein